MNNFKKYPSYKDSDSPWFPSIPAHWEILPNRYIFDLKKSQVGKKSNQYKLLSLTLNGVIERDMENPSGKFPAEFDTYQEVKKGDFIFCLFDVEETPRTVGLSEFDGMITGAYTVFRNRLAQNAKFLYYFFLSLDEKKRLKPLYKGLRNTISKESFYSFKTPLPPLKEQTAIANFLDKKTAEIKEFIALKEKTIELLKERKMAIINELVTEKKVWNGDAWTEPSDVKDSGIEWLGEIPKHWEVKKIKYFIDFINRGSTPNYVESSDSKVVNQATFSKGFWNESEIKFTQIKSPEDARGLLFENDILMASTGGGLLGKVGFFQNLEGNYIADSHVTIIRDNKRRIDPMFYYYLFSTLYSWIDGTLSKGSTNQIELQRELLRGSKFPFPIIETQKLIVKHINNKLNEIDGLMNQTKKEIELIKEYQQSLISEVVTGKVDVSSFTL